MATKGTLIAATLALILFVVDITCAARFTFPTNDAPAPESAADDLADGKEGDDIGAYGIGDDTSESNKSSDDNDTYGVQVDILEDHESFGQGDNGPYGPRDNKLGDNGPHDPRFDRPQGIGSYFQRDNGPYDPRDNDDTEINRP
ncbi:hypothetical protein ACFE04_024090 [Oxalis oulophora]